MDDKTVRPGMWGLRLVTDRDAQVKCLLNLVYIREDHPDAFGSDGDWACTVIDQLAALMAGERQGVSGG